MINDSIKVLSEKSLFDRRENLEPHMSYAHEQIRHRIITEGRIDQLDEVLRIQPDGTAGRVSTDDLRNQKNMFISAITLFTRAAMDGGLPEELAYAMSDSYIQNGESCRSFEEIDRLYHRAFSEFTHGVAEYQHLHHGPKIEHAFHYITIHLHEKITLDQVAEAVSLSPCYLSRLFLKETGMSIVDFIQKERVDAAKHMLTYSDYTLAAISQYLHFSNQSYFVKIFKKYTGKTPGQYRKTHAW